MAKTEKKAFAWDTETKIGEFGDNKAMTQVYICTLNGKTYVSAVSYIASTKEPSGWKRTKNNSMQIDVFKGVQDIFGKWEMKEAFGSETKAEAPKQKKPTRKETDKAMAKAVEDLKKKATQINGAEPIKGTKQRKNAKKSTTGIEKK